jgi:hypothetical protein
VPDPGFLVNPDPNLDPKPKKINYNVKKEQFFKSLIAIYFLEPSMKNFQAQEEACSSPA